MEQNEIEWNRTEQNAMEWNRVIKWNRMVFANFFPHEIKFCKISQKVFAKFRFVFAFFAGNPNYRVIFNKFYYRVISQLKSNYRVMSSLIEAYTIKAELACQQKHKVNPLPFRKLGTSFKGRKLNTEQAAYKGVVLVLRWFNYFSFVQIQKQRKVVDLCPWQGSLLPLVKMEYRSH